MADSFAQREASILGAPRALTSRLPVHAATWVLLAFSCGTVLSAALQRLLEPGQSVQRLVELNVGEMFGTAALVSLVLTAPHFRPELTRLDLAALLVCAMAWFVPQPHAVYVATTLAGVWFVARRPGNRLLAEVGQVWLVLSLCELWSKLVFKLFYQAIAPFEVALMAWAGRLAYPGLQTVGVYLSARPDWSVVMLEGCSAFHNLSLAGLIWFCVLKIANRGPSPKAFGALTVSAALVVAINVARILAMLPSAEAYRFWHDGQGSVIVALASVLASVVPVVIHVERTACPPRRSV